MIPVRFDPDLPRTWSGPLRMILGTRLYVDMSMEVISERQIDELGDLIRRANPRTMWRTAVAQTRIVPRVAITPKVYELRPPSAPPPLTAARPTTALPVQREHPLTIRKRVQRLQHVVGHEVDGHLADVVQRLAETLLGTVDTALPMIERVAKMERELGLV